MKTWRFMTLVLVGGLLGACGSDDGDDGPSTGGVAGALTGGMGATGGGGGSTGGTGGSLTGGTGATGPMGGSGGSETGGSETGGSETGGSETGGSETGGSETGGSETGGSGGEAGVAGESSAGASGDAGDAGAAGQAGASGTGGSSGAAGFSCTYPATPSGPSPNNNATVEPGLSSVNWQDSTGAQSYEVYVGPICPPPDYPSSQYYNVKVSELTGLGLSQNTDYCWKVVAIGDSSNCYSEGPDWAFSVSCYQPTIPTGPVPANGSAADVLSTDTIAWDIVPSALGYDVYFGTTCPPPSYPSSEYVAVSQPELSGISLSYGENYCWKVVARNGSCTTQGSDWTFSTTCTDPVPGVPQVTSSDFVYHSFKSTGSYLLTFSEGVKNVASNVTWSAVSGSGVMSNITAVSDSQYRIDFEGVAVGDSYTLHIGSTIVDRCSTPLDSNVEISITISDQGSTCSQAINLDGLTLPTTLVGDFTEAPQISTACAAKPTNVVWMTYTAQQSGLHRIAAINGTTMASYSRLALFQGTACPPSGSELLCVTASSKSIEAFVTLTQGTTYTLMYFTDGSTYTMVNPQIDFSFVSLGPGQDCSTAMDLTTQTLPYTASGDFPYEFSTGGTCDTTPFNMAWFSYEPAVSSWYAIQASTASTTETRLAVFETATCNPRGKQLACVTGSGSSSTSAYMAQGQQYLIAFHANNNTQAMSEPTIDLSPVFYSLGETCADPIDVSTAAFPYQQSGTFDVDLGPGGSCDTAPNNVVWFRYTPSITAYHDINLTNATSTAAYSRLALFEGSDCTSIDAEILCKTASAKTVSASTVLHKDTDYLMAFYTDGESYTMVNPSISIVKGAVPQPGEFCSIPALLTGQSFPVQLMGTFADSSSQGGSCDTSPTNTVWFEYTPAVSGSHTITAVNATTTAAYSRLAIFEGLSCYPTGTELDCKTVGAKTVTTTVNLTAGTPYLLAFFTDGSTYTMVNPSVTITAN